MPAEPIEVTHGDVLISTDPARIDVAVVHRYLSNDSYWAEGRSYDVMSKAISNSNLVLGAYSDNGRGEQVGFARMVTDLATYAWLADVFVLPRFRGDGLGRVIVQTIVEHPEVVNVKTQFLATRDAHELYERFGYTRIAEPDRWMHRRAST